jgi:hypothetical protein
MWTILLILLLLVVPVSSHAQVFSVNLSSSQFAWTASAIDATHPTPASYHVKCGTVKGVYPLIVTVPAPATSVLVSKVLTAPGTYYCVVTARNVSGESAPSNEIQLSVVLMVFPPTQFKVTP